MMSQDNRLMPLPNMPERSLDRPLSDLTTQKPYGLSASEPTHLRDYLHIVLKRKWLILALFLIVTTLVTIQMYRQPSVYQSQAVVQIDAPRQSVLGTGKDGVVISMGNQRDPNYLNTQQRHLSSNSLARQVVLALGLQKDPTFLGTRSQTSILTSLRRLLGSEKRSDTPVAATGDNSLPVITENEVQSGQLSKAEMIKLEPYEDAIKGNLEIEPIPQTTQVMLKYKHTNPATAQAVVNTLADIFRDNNGRAQLTGTERDLQVVSEKVAELQTKIRQQEETKYAYIRRNNLPANASPAANLAAERLLTLSKQLQDAENELRVQQAQYDAATNADQPDAVPDIQDNPSYVKIRDRIIELEARRRELLQTYTEDWPEVKKVEEQVRFLQAELIKRPQEVRSGFRIRFDAAQRKVQSLRVAYENAKAVYSQQNGATLDLSIMDQQLETDNQYLHTLQQRQRELEGVGSDRTKVNNISVAEHSRLPGSPVGPQRMRNILIASLLSLFAGVGLAFLLHYLDDTVKSADDVERYIHLPTLAMIPSQRSDRKRLGSGDNLSGGEAASTALALIKDERSPVAEAYRHLRTSLLLSSAGHAPKAILVTSSQPSEGKTTTAVNTAVMLARTGATVVIVDCDLRRPRIHAHFNLPNFKGITNCLSGESAASEVLQSAPDIPNLRVLSSGPIPPNPAELLGSDEMRRLVNELTEKYTHVIIDSPPCISFTDASILSTMVDGVMLVVHAGRSSRTIVRRAKQQLQDVGAHIYGLVLNNVKFESHDYYYYSGYYASHYYNDPDEEEAEVVETTQGGKRL